jgi:hypothetical protein
MIVLCADEAASVIWIDPRGRQFRRAEFVALVFGRIDEWQRMLGHADGPLCLHVMRTKTEILTLERARHLVVQRMGRLQARIRRSRIAEAPQDTTLDGA